MTLAEFRMGAAGIRMRASFFQRRVRTRMRSPVYGSIFAHCSRA